MRASRQQQQQCKANNMRGHVMISYESKSQELMKKVVSFFKSKGYKVWIDIENTKGNLNDGMVEGIENAAVVLIAMSKKYEENRNCRKEAEYAETKGIPMIPLLVESGYRGDKWLGLVVGKKQSYDLTKEDRFNTKMTEIIKAIDADRHSKEPVSEKCNEKVAQQKVAKVEDLPLPKQQNSSSQDEHIDLRWKLNCLYILDKDTPAKPRLSDTRWCNFREDIKPVLVEKIGIQGINLELCHHDVFNFTARCRNNKILLIYEVTDGSDDNSNIVSGIVSTLPRLTKLRELDVRNFYLGKRSQDLFTSIASCVNIRVLIMTEFKLTGSGPTLVSILPLLSLLSYLDLLNLNLSPEDMKQIVHCLSSSCGNLIHLKIGGFAFKSQGFKPVSELNKLKSLGFEANLPDDLIAILWQLPPHMQLLYLGGGVSSTRQAHLRSALIRYTKLQYLVIDDGKLNSEHEWVLNSELTKRGGRLVVIDKDDQGLLDYQAELKKLKDECFNA